jgi:dienelactone hydrolase
LPIDDAHGPYPVVFYIHGTAAMRIASGAQMTHWASRGFVVVAADHPGMYLADMLYAVPDIFGEGCLEDSRDPQDVPRDIDLMLEALEDPSGDLAFLAGRLDMRRIGMTGHSQGAGIAANMSEKSGVRISIPLAGRNPVVAGPDLESVLFFGGELDSLVTADAQRTGFQQSPAPKRQVLVANAEHLVMTDLCGGKNKDGQDAMEIAEEYDVCGIGLAGVLWKCSPDYISQEKGTEITNYVTAAALEETLHCQDRASAFAELESRYPEVSELNEVLQ